MTEAELQEIDAYLAGESGSGAGDERTRNWVRRLRGEVQRLRDAGAPLKQHGDALLDGSGTRHGEHARGGGG
jgi:hypothetical protein